MTLAEPTGATSSYLLDTGWIESLHISGVLTEHLVNVVPEITELTYIIADMGFSPQEPDFPSHYCEAKMNYDGELFEEDKKSYRFDYITGTYRGEVNGATAVNPVYSPFRLGITAENILLPNTEIASAVLFPKADTPATIYFETSSSINDATVFSFRFRVITHTEAVKFIGSVMP
jgi:hypothetical protein